jgi:hypothetical protein
MTIEMPNLNSPQGDLRDKRNTRPSGQNSGQSFGELLRSAQTASRETPQMQNPAASNTVTGIAVFPRSGDENDVVKEYLENLCNQPGISNAQRILLAAAHSIVMHQAKVNGGPSDPAALLQRIIQLASEFDQNLTGQPSELPNIAQKMGGLYLA